MAKNDDLFTNDNINKIVNYIKKNHCTVCGGLNIRVLLKDDTLKLKQFIINFYKLEDINLIGDKFSFEVRECLDCSHIYHANILDDEGIKKLYTHLVPHREKILNNKTDKTLKNIEFSTKISSIMNKKINVLDFGSGKVNYPNDNENCKFFTCEISTVKKSEQEIDVKNLINMEFDLVIANQVMEHLTRPKEISIIFQKILTKNGILKIELPSSFFLKFKIFLYKIFGPKEIFLADCFPLEHVNSYSKKSLLKLFENFTEYKDHTNDLYWCDNDKNLKNNMRWLSVKYWYLRVLFSFFLLKNGGHYLIMKKKIKDF
ncbi:hypothetical protein [Candidatus Pelagibacter sp. Uisw_113]|uniref:hypothetical protein n=1 Tax=Candidatus Pelagibacter sp. Uisw_113 TaxID=3230994 RepID=UPI0039EC6761